MAIRRDWNSIGPKIPLWFRRELARVDPRLVLQFMPPDWFDREGVDARDYPCGLWVIVRRLSRSGCLYCAPTWTYAMVDAAGRQKEPDHGDLRLIRAAKDAWRTQQHDEMFGELDSSLAAIRTNKKQRKMAERAAYIDQRLTQHGEKQYYNRVSMN